ncbi:DEKNAAC104947 [Brettanomyces naardenensis]|uniref:GTPase-activating protein GYP7 n=1 Tax=Brettanomyces naardenensis TaxID=13370 RepID=A0A448YSB3_BRENA|nr:DEKNAAC104947 [Brettanomyces naardenensis]
MVHIVSPRSFPPGKGQLLYVKSKVYVHVTSSKKDNVPGYLVIVKPFPDSPKTDLVVAFIPESDVSQDDVNALDYFDLYGLDGEENNFYGNSNGSTSSATDRGNHNGGGGRSNYPKVARFIERPRMSSMSSFAFGLAISNIFSIQVRPKTTTLWEGSVVLHPKDVLEKVPALFFHDDESAGTKREQKLKSQRFDPFAENSKGGLYWGGDRFVSCMRNYCVLEESTLEKGMYLVNPSKDDTINFIPNVLDESEVGNGPESVGNAVNEFLNGAKWRVLTGLASVTSFAKKQLNGMTQNGSIPAPIRNLLNQPQVRVVGDDFDSANVYLAKWALAVQEEAEKSRKQIVGNDYYRELMESELGNETTVALTPQEVSRARRLKPVSKVEWESQFDSSGRLQITMREVLDRVFHGGLEPEARREAWLFLLKVYPFDTSSEERQQLLASLYESYVEYKNSWKGDLERQDKDAYWKDQKVRIDKDVRRTDREIDIYKGGDPMDVETTGNEDPDDDAGLKNPHLMVLRDILFSYNELNHNLGYVQGMSDLVSPLYYVLRDEPLTFWAFARFMEVMERNFVRDLSGMKEQMLTLTELVQFMMPSLYQHLEQCDSGNLFFFFRMLLVWFKRELSFEDTLKLWEILWTNYYSSQFVLFFSLAILEKHSKIIMNTLNRFDDILKYMNDLSGTLEIDDLLVRAELLFMKFKQVVEMIDRRNAGIGFSAVQGDVDSSLQRIPISKQLRLLLSTEPVIQRENPREVGDPIG